MGKKQGEQVPMSASQRMTPDQLYLRITRNQTGFQSDVQMLYDAVKYLENELALRNNELDALKGKATVKTGMTEPKPVATVQTKKHKKAKK